MLNINVTEIIFFLSSPIKTFFKASPSLMPIRFKILLLLLFFLCFKNILIDLTRIRGCFKLLIFISFYLKTSELCHHNNFKCSEIWFLLFFSSSSSFCTVKRERLKMFILLFSVNVQVKCRTRDDDLKIIFFLSPHYTFLIDFKEESSGE